MGNHPMTRLSSLIGTWNCEETYHAGGWVQQEVKSKSASDTFRGGPGKFSIPANYTSESDVVGTFKAVDLILWEKQKKKFIFIIAYNFNAEHEIQEGYMPDDNHIVFESKTTFMEKPVTARRIYTLGEKTSQLLFEYEYESCEKVKVVTIKKRKQS
jgi:hypothetical protein